MTQTLYLNATSVGDIEFAAKMLRDGKLVAFPTETVYGLGAHAMDLRAVGSVFEAKKRPSHNPLIVHVSDMHQAFSLFDFEGSEHGDLFFQRFNLLKKTLWPGPLSLVGRKAQAVSDLVTGGAPKVAVRVPSHPVALELLRLAGVPIAAPSANLFTRPSPTLSDHVLANLSDRIDAVLDGGQTYFGIESTVVDIDAEFPSILRHGAISGQDLASLMPDLIVNSTDAQQQEQNGSPGMCKRHYSPDIGEVKLGSEEEIAQAWFGSSGLILRAQSQLRIQDVLGRRPASAGPTCVLPDDPLGYARDLFSAFYEMEAQRPSRLILEDLSNLASNPAWASICDKLFRAKNIG